MIKTIHALLSIADIALNIHADENGSVRVVLTPLLKKTLTGDSAPAVKTALSKPLIITGTIDEVDSALTTILTDFTKDYTEKESLVSHSLHELNEIEKTLKEKKAAAVRTGTKQTSKPSPDTNHSEHSRTLTHASSHHTEDDLFAAPLPSSNLCPPPIPLTHDTDPDQNPHPSAPLGEDQ
jgi:PRTRC genetic system protein E